ncbi:GNAT family N-acetyltransferase [Streptomyces uncialis]|uniref:GNAT family N-acetyltransferase n=1 Tax=Streptomyces uncialis TaxID=1048205 RepID=UPI003865DC9B|nr:GNAT family N-acetyltransferase [Streptomyces uncialis]
MEIRPAHPADAEGIALVHVRAWQAAYAGIVPREHLDALDPVAAAEVWAERLAASEAPRARVLVAVADSADSADRIVAFAGFRPAEPVTEATTEPAPADAPEDGEIHTMYAHPDHWGTGVGRALMEATTTALAAAGYRDGTLWVLADNTRARRFYEAAGWRFDGATAEETTGGAVLPELRYRKPLTGTRTQT